MLRLWTREGVPVLKRRRCTPIFSRLAERYRAGSVASGPLSYETSPTWITPLRYVPVAIITFLTLYLAPRAVTIPVTTPFSAITSVTSACFMSRFS